MNTAPRHEAPRHEWRGWKGAFAPSVRNGRGCSSLCVAPSAADGQRILARRAIHGVVSDGSQRQMPRRQHGFTLVEVMVALPLATLLLLGTVCLYIMALQLGSKTSAELATTQDAANAIQQVVEMTREAQAFTLPNETGFTMPTGDSVNNFETTLNGATVFTGVEVTMPPALKTTDVGYSDTSLKYITVKSATGTDLPATPQSAPLAFPPYNCTGTATQQYIIYRADSGGTPDAAAGGFLWEQSLGSTSPSVSTALCRTVATGASNSVQFVRPVDSGGSTLPYQMEIKIISGAYSAINGVQTDEEGNGTYTSKLVGKCVLMRDHSTTVPAPTKGVNNPFQAD